MHIRGGGQNDVSLNYVFLRRFPKKPFAPASSALPVWRTIRKVFPIHQPQCPLLPLSSLCVCVHLLFGNLYVTRKWSSYMTLEITQHLCTKSRQKSQTPTLRRTSLMLKVPTRNSSTSTFLVCICKCRVSIFCGQNQNKTA